MNRRDLLKASLAGIAASGLARADCGDESPAETANETADLRKAYVDGPFGQIHYYRQGDGPALVLAHQSPVSARMFERAMPVLAGLGITAIAVDTPGYGNSDLPCAPPTIEQYADAFVEVLEGLDLKTAHLLGHHTGASILCNLAARFPQRVESLTLSGPPLFSDEDLQGFKDRKHAPHPVYRDGSHLQEHWDRRTKYSPGWTNVVAMHRRLVDQLWAGDTSWYGHAAAFAYDMRPDFMALRTRTLILTNTGDDIFDLAQAARSARPDFAYAELQGGTHDIVDEQPEAWSREVASFALGDESSKEV